jgi:checkpoint serine/threonine-protein kinase
MLMDCPSQTTLQDLINGYLSRGSKMEETLVIYYTIEMLKMVEELHSIGIIHGDFKPDNLLVLNGDTRQDFAIYFCWLVFF